MNNLRTTLVSSPTRASFALTTYTVGSLQAILTGRADAVPPLISTDPVRFIQRGDRDLFNLEGGTFERCPNFSMAQDVRIKDGLVDGVLSSAVMITLTTSNVRRRDLFDVGRFRARYRNMWAASQDMPVLVADARSAFVIDAVGRQPKRDDIYFRCLRLCEIDNLLETRS